MKLIEIWFSEFHCGVIVVVEVVAVVIAIALFTAALDLSSMSETSRPDERHARTSLLAANDSRRRCT